MKIQSSYNVVVPLNLDTSNNKFYLLFNTLAGSIDVVDRLVVSGLGRLPIRQTRLPKGAVRISGESELPTNIETYLDRRGYIFESFEDELQRSAVLYQELLRFHRKAVRQPLVVIPTYNCNMNCPYCWQRLHHLDSPVITASVVDRIFEVIPQFRDASESSKIDLVVFGGEPLQEIPELTQRVLHILGQAREAGYSTKILTNGICLEQMVPYLEGKVDVIQVTIDGTGPVHRRRRPYLNGDSFQLATDGISAAIARGIRVNVRVNMDHSNLTELPALSEFAQSIGWLKSGLVNLILAPVKNHNPHHKARPEKELLVDILEMVRNDPRMSVYNLTGFSGIKYFEGFKATGLLSLHRFFSCEAQINFFAFDLFGDIYACWEAAGTKELAIGQFLPKVELFNDKLDIWRARSAMNIKECKTCVSAPHCGGGCQFQSLEHTGSFLNPICDSMLDGYIQAFWDNSKWLMERARKGDHAVGFVTAGQVVTPVTSVYGTLASGQNQPLLVDC